MAGSGLQILAAYPRSDRAAGCIAGIRFRTSRHHRGMRFGGMARRRASLAFAIAWFSLQLLQRRIYLIYMTRAANGGAAFSFRRREHDQTHFAMFAYYLRIRKTPPPRGIFTTALQRVAVNTSGVLSVCRGPAGLAIYQQVQLYWLTGRSGGYDVARVVHLELSGAAGLFTLCT